MKTQQAIVNDSGWEAILVEDLEIRCDLPYQYREVIPPTPRPLTQYHTPWVKVEVIERWQYLFDGEWRTEDREVTYKEYKNFEAYVDDHKYTGCDTRLAFEVVSEEESNHIADVGKKVSVEEAAEKYVDASYPNYQFKPMLVECINGFLQSGEYVRKSDVEKMIRGRIAYLETFTPDDTIKIQLNEAYMFLTILKNKQ